MRFINNGVMVFDDIYEAFYNLFNEIGLSLNQNQYLTDDDSGISIKYKDKYIKSAVTPVPVYAGKTDILFEPWKNYNLMTTLFGYFVDKQTSLGNNIGFSAQYVEDNETRDRQRLIVKTVNGDIVSRFYVNIFLAYFEAIFKLSGFGDVDLSNLDGVYQ